MVAKPLAGLPPVEMRKETMNILLGSLQRGAKPIDTRIFPRFLLVLSIVYVRVEESLVLTMDNVVDEFLNKRSADLDLPKDAAHHAVCLKRRFVSVLVGELPWHLRER